MTTIALHSARPAVPRLRITARGRTVVATLLVAPVLVIAVLLAGRAPGAVAEQQVALDTYSYVVVAPGQSLWQLAEALAPTADPREVVAEILALNQLRSASVDAGQKLAIPSAYAN